MQKIQKQETLRILFSLCLAVFFGACSAEKLSFSEEAMVRFDDSPGHEGEALFHGIDGYHRLPFKDVNGYAIAGFDMVLGRTEDVIEQSRVLEEQGVRSDALSGSKSLEGNAYSKWPDGVVPYVIQSSASGFRQVIEQAVSMWNSKTPVTWKERTNESNYVEFKSGSGCWSYVGRIGGKQTISVDDYCKDKGSMAHEMAHALGFLHEHQRSDRDQYVKVIEDRIPSGSASQFRKENGGIFLSDYDFNSITHYNGYWFRPAPGQNPGSIGMGSTLSAKDIAGAKKIYGDGGDLDDDDNDDDDEDDDDDGPSTACVGQVVFTTAQVQALSDCTIILGDIHVARNFNGTELVLPNLFSLQGKLIVQGVKKLKRIEIPGADNLRYGMKITGNKKLEEILLPTTNSFYAPVIINKNHALKEVNIAGEKPFMTLHKRLQITNNRNLESLELGPLMTNGQRRISIRRNGDLETCRNKDCANENF